MPVPASSSHSLSDHSTSIAWLVSVSQSACPISHPCGDSSNGLPSRWLSSCWRIVRWAFLLLQLHDWEEQLVAKQVVTASQKPLCRWWCCLPWPNDKCSSGRMLTRVWTILKHFTNHPRVWILIEFANLQKGTTITEFGQDWLNHSPVESNRFLSLRHDTTANLNSM